MPSSILHCPLSILGEFILKVLHKAPSPYSPTALVESRIILVEKMLTKDQQIISLKNVSLPEPF